MTRPVATDSSLERMLRLLETHNPNLRELLGAMTESQFVDATENALERVMRTIENGAKLYSILDERGLSKLLADLLTLSGYQAVAERYRIAPWFAPKALSRSAEGETPVGTLETVPKFANRSPAATGARATVPVVVIGPPVNPAPV